MQNAVVTREENLGSSNENRNKCWTHNWFVSLLQKVAGQNIPIFSRHEAKESTQ